ncbi:MAG: endonuclease V [Candidatus Omnitrophica bacterium]|nr:endonuclease V [Candidatus Omnitrophota bacterium]
MKFKNLHPWNPNLTEAVSIQNKLRKKIKLKKLTSSPKLIAGVDVAFKGSCASGAVVVLDYSGSNKRPRIVEKVRKTSRIPYPYIPGLLAFREGPVIKKCFSALKTRPDVIIFDGQGIAHPRNMGIATHLGILLDKPTIGCAKSYLFGKYIEPENFKGAFSYLYVNDRKIGAVLRTRPNVRPIFISPGHKIDIESSLQLIFMCTERYRLPEPIRLAHQLAQKITV